MEHVHPGIAIPLVAEGQGDPPPPVTPSSQRMLHGVQMVKDERMLNMKKKRIRRVSGELA